MKRFLRWLKMEFFGPANSNASDRMSDTVSAEPRRSNTVRSGNDVVMPDIYADVEADLKALDQPTPDIEEPDEFNPYDTAVLQKKQR